MFWGLFIKQMVRIIHYYEPGSGLPLTINLPYVLVRKRYKV